MQVPSEFGTLHREHGKMHSVEVCKSCETRFRQLRTFSCDGGRSARTGLAKGLALIALSASKLLFFSEMVRYLVDPASSHMLVSKIKPCMSKYKLLYGETADGSLKQLLFP